LGDFGIKIAEAKNGERKMVNLKILNKINMLQLDVFVERFGNNCRAEIRYVIFNMGEIPCAPARYMPKCKML